MPDRSKASRLAVLAPVVLIIVAVAAAIIMLLGDDDQTAQPVSVAAQGPTFETLDALFEASDLVVEGSVVSMKSGRTISDPVNPDAGLVTSLSQLAVSAVYKGDVGDVVVIEQEATLVDGTPIVVNGLDSNETGDNGFWFLIRGSSEEFPYVALVNEQSRMLVDDLQQVVDSPLTGPIDAAQLRARLVDLHRVPGTD